MTPVILSVVFALVLIGVIVAQHRSDAALLQRANRAIAAVGDDRLEPQRLEDAINRLEDLALRVGDRDLELRRATAAFERLSTGAIVADADGQVVVRNAAAQPYESGRHGDALVENVIQGCLEEALRNRTTDDELRLHGPPERVLLVVGCPIVLSGELIGAVVLIDDVSEQQRLDAVRRDFVANVSHELRTPVGALALLAETLEGEEDPEVIATFLGRIQDESGRLSRLIDDLLDLSRIESGLSESVEDVDLGSVLAEAEGAVRAAGEHKGVELSLSLEPVPTIRGDRNQLVSAVTNLLSNGIKYTDAGGTVSGRLVSHANELAVVVEDTGIGIPQRDITRVFERFYRVDRGRNAETGGTGLGLSIVRHVAVNHGGRVECVSQEGIGSTFSMVLPVRDGSGPLDLPIATPASGELDE